MIYYITGTSINAGTAYFLPVTTGNWPDLLFSTGKSCTGISVVDSDLRGETL